VAWEMARHAPSPSHVVRGWSGSTPAPTYRPASAVYRPRRPTETPLYPVVQHHLETFLAQAQDTDPMGWGVPAWVERDFRGYLRCGILAHGFARLRCGDCGHDRLLAFSCKGRGVCPSCNARRMAEVAAHLTDEVIPHLPVRQWVLSVPNRLRPFLHQTPEVASAVLTIFVRALRSALRDASPGAPARVRDVQFGAISFPQRFDSSLNAHYHYHVLALDGMVSGDVERGVRFHEATRLEARDAEALARTVQLRVLRKLIGRIRNTRDGSTHNAIVPASLPDRPPPLRCRNEVVGDQVVEGPGVHPGPGAGGIRGGDHGELQLRHHEDVLPPVAPGEVDVVAPTRPGDRSGFMLTGVRGATRRMLTAPFPAFHG
jgi:hypothetical protein